MMTHTPGPWKWYTSNSYTRLGTDGDYHELMYAESHQDGYASIVCRNEADANLIAAAPELLSVLKDFHRRCRCTLENSIPGELPRCFTCTTAESAIAKAEGRS